MLDVMTARIYCTNGAMREITLATDDEAQYHQLSDAVGGLIELVDMGELWLVCNEEGKILGLPFNKRATEIARPYLRDDDWGICGDAVICHKGAVN